MHPPRHISRPLRKSATRLQPYSQKPKCSPASGTPAPARGCSAARASVSSRSVPGTPPAPGRSLPYPFPAKTHKAPPLRRTHCRSSIRPAETPGRWRFARSHKASACRPDRWRTDPDSPSRSESHPPPAAASRPRHLPQEYTRTPGKPPSSASCRRRYYPSPQTESPTREDPAASSPPPPRAPATRISPADG